MINGFEYSWEDISLTVFGKLVTGFAGIDYNTEKQHMNIYGRGSKPVAMGRGNKQFSGTLVLLQSELESIQAKLPKGKDITDVTSTKITVSYAPEGGVITTDVLKNVRFTSIPKGMKQGAANMEIQMPFICGDIEYNV